VTVFLLDDTVERWPTLLWDKNVSCKASSRQFIAVFTFFTYDKIFHASALIFRKLFQSVLRKVEAEHAPLISDAIMRALLQMFQSSVNNKTGGVQVPLLR
jgi:hypothetical protein